jgi:integrase
VPRTPIARSIVVLPTPLLRFLATVAFFDGSPVDIEEWKTHTAGNSLTVGKSKTAAGSGRIIPLNPRAVATLTHWHGFFPCAQPEHHLFPHEKYGFAGNDRQLCAYETIPTEPMHRWKVGWEIARKTAEFSCRVHGLRHTFISRLAESHRTLHKTAIFTSTCRHSVPWPRTATAHSSY